jgi:signal transduction histidine kinase
MLVAALAVAQIGLIFVLHGQQDNVIDDIVHGQALNQTVTLAKLVISHRADDSKVLTDAFGSRQSCAAVTADAPVKHEMSAPEQELAGILKRQLHGLQTGFPIVTIEPLQQFEHACERHGGDIDRSHFDEAKQQDRIGADRFRIVALSLMVPFPDGRWLVTRTAITVPGAWNWAAFLSFLFSSLAVTAVVILAVRSQTTSLRALADASERLGRGEEVQPLVPNGPSEVSSTIRAFNTMQERLGLFMRDRLRLLASISHDLRTPLTTLRLKAELIDDEATRDDLVATIEELTIICEATLAFTRAEATTETTSVVNVVELVEQVLDEFRMGKGDVSLTASAAIQLPCRPVALKRAIRNLVENALRYGERASLSLHRDQDFIRIIVDDSGPGIPADRMDDAFQPFVRLEPSRSTETGGIGLGLSIARSIVQAHGGTILLSNLEPIGLRAEIHLPVQ